MNLLNRSPWDIKSSVDGPRFAPLIGVGDTQPRVWTSALTS